MKYVDVLRPRKGDYRYRIVSRDDGFVIQRKLVTNDLEGWLSRLFNDWETYGSYGQSCGTYTHANVAIFASRDEAQKALDVEAE